MPYWAKLQNFIFEISNVRYSVGLYIGIGFDYNPGPCEYWKGFFLVIVCTKLKYLVKTFYLCKVCYLLSKCH